MKDTVRQMAMLAAIMMAGGNLPKKKKKPVQQRILSEKDKKRIEKIYASQLHEYVIGGETIIAPNKKTAIKILKRRANRN